MLILNQRADRFTTSGLKFNKINENIQKVLKNSVKVVKLHDKIVALYTFQLLKLFCSRVKLSWNNAQCVAVTIR